MAPQVPASVFMGRFGNALLRIGAAAALGFCHWLMDKGIVYIVPTNVKYGRVALEDIAFVAFGLIYVHLLWDTASLFVPWMNPKAEREVASEVAGESAS